MLSYTKRANNFTCLIRNAAQKKGIRYEDYDPLVPPGSGGDTGMNQGWYYLGGVKELVALGFCTTQTMWRYLKDVENIKKL